jgi:biopolymer transport protein ExbD
MGASIGIDPGKSLNIEVNIVPFIDLMSCMTAFLLVTAVWANVSQLDTHPQGRDRAGIVDAGDDPQLSVLVDADAVWIGVSRLDDFQRFPRTEHGYDWPLVQAALRLHKQSAIFADRTNIEVAASSSRTQPVEYGALITAMDIAVTAGFTDVVVTEPNALSAQPQL